MKTEILQEIIRICDESLSTDHFSESVHCECGKEIGTPVDLWEPIGRSDTYMIRNTLQSMIKNGDLSDVMILGSEVKE